MSAKYTILKMMPNSPLTIIRDTYMRHQVLATIDYFLSLFVEALTAFYVDKHYHKFDAHVGETACQIRACQILLASQEELPYSLEEKIESVEQLRFKVRALIEDHGRQIGNHSFSLEGYLAEHDLLFEFTELEAFLLQAYFLTKYKVAGPNIYTHLNFNEIYQSSDFSKKYTKKLARKIQQNLSLISCEKVIQWNNILNLYNRRFIESLLWKDLDGRWVLPCFLYNDIIFHMLHSCSIPMLLIISVQNENLAFSFMGNEVKKIDELNEIAYEKFQPYFVIKGYSNFSGATQDLRGAIEEYGIYNLILLNGASHPQYPTGREDHFLVDSSNEALEFEKKYRACKRLSIAYGFSQQAPHTFVVKHVYVDYACRVLSEIGLERLYLQQETILQNFELQPI